jgi:hypothetical protein
MTKEQLLQAILTMAATSEKIPDRQALETQIDGFLQGVPALIAERDWILARALEVLVTAVQEAEELIDPDTYIPWIESEDRSTWASWPWLELYLRHRLRRPVSVMQELDRSTDRILDLLGDPKRDGLWDRRGLVVGHVQSGKTQHYTALAAKAIDSGYKVIIILSGIHENLRQQTQERIEECITGKNSRDKWIPFGVRSFQENYVLPNRPGNQLPEIDTLTSVPRDYNSATIGSVDFALGNTPKIFVVKKNASILKNVLQKLRGPEGNLTFQKAPVLVIDDEADHSSPNAANLDEDPKTINRLIRKILWCCDKVAFVGYTATPYANIFMDDELGDQEKSETRQIDNYGYDLFPRAFIRSNKAPSNYIGPDVVFGHDGDETVGIPKVSSLPMQVPVVDADAWLPPGHPKQFQVTSDLPASLQLALKCFVLSVAARMARGQETSHCSMLVHVTRFIDVQNQVMILIEAHMEALLNLLVGAAPQERTALMQAFQNIWEQEFVTKFPAFQAHPSQINDPPVLPNWDDVQANLNRALTRITIALVNSNNKQGLDYANNQNEGLIVIAVGGDRLSRGLTLEGLTISYFLRGARAYDTLMQMGRWFGYRLGYAHLCRVFAPISIISNFRTVVLATEELRREFDMMSYLKKTPVNYGLRIREPRSDLLVTAMNRMRRGVTVKIHFAHSLISSLDIKETDLDSNYRAFVTLVHNLQMKHGAPDKVDASGNARTDGPSRIWKNVLWQDLTGFFAQYNATINTCLDRATAAGKSLLHNYIESVHSKGDLIKWTVVVIGSSRGKSSVSGMDTDFLAVSRNRLMNEPKLDQPQHPGRVTFKGVALGGDESMDLTDLQREQAFERREESGRKLSLASIYRAMRPSTHGLLLIYPIIPATPQAAEDAGNSDEAYLWAGRDPLIGIGVSLPDSAHDTGCDYVCTKQKLREIFGEISDDLERDEEEMGENSHESATDPSRPLPPFYESLLKLMGFTKGTVPKIKEDAYSMPFRVVRGIWNSRIFHPDEAQKAISEQERKFLMEILESPSSDRSGNAEGDGLMDLLGTYDSIQKLVVLYTRAIELTARAKGIPYENLYTIVLCHELAHAANHLGLCNARLTWERFANASSDDKEFFAQIYAHHHFEQTGMNALAVTMRDFTYHQPLKYAKYLDYLDETVDEINLRLMRVRMQ